MPDILKPLLKSLVKLARLLYLLVLLFLWLLIADYALNALKNHGFLNELRYQKLLYPVLLQLKLQTSEVNNDQPN